jgi:hypothetical protein
MTPVEAIRELIELRKNCGGVAHLPYDVRIKLLDIGVLSYADDQWSDESYRPSTIDLVIQRGEAYLAERVAEKLG